MCWTIVQRPRPEFRCRWWPSWNFSCRKSATGSNRWWITWTGPASSSSSSNNNNSKLRRPNSRLWRLADRALRRPLHPASLRTCRSSSNSTTECPLRWPLWFRPRCAEWWIRRPPLPTITCCSIRRHPPALRRPWANRVNRNRAGGSRRSQT